MDSTTKPVPTDVVVNKFFNGFMNGYIFESLEKYRTNIEYKDAEDFDIDFLVSVWKLGAAFGIAAREGANN